MPTPHAVTPQPELLPELPPAQEKFVLYTLAGVQFAHILDFMVMMPLGPLLMRTLQIDTHQFGLLVSAYTFTASASGILAATFIDRFERKRLLLTFFIGFIVATLACGLAPGYGSLLFARAAAGAMGGVLGAMAQTIVGDVIPFTRRGRASGVLMSAFSLATVAGVPISLYLANHFGWRFPFYFIGAMALLLFGLGMYALPRLSSHLRIGQAAQHPLKPLWEVLRQPNHLRALGFMALVTFSGFVVIPYITIYITSNVHIPQNQIPLIYLFGGTANFFSAQWIGRWADRYGKVKVYRTMAWLSLIPLLIQTHLVPIPLWLMICCSTLFFVLVPGRMVPAMAIVTSAVEPRLRGTFMSLNASTQQLASGSAAYLTGWMITRNVAGEVEHYDRAGYLAVVVTMLAVWLVGRVQMRSQAPSSLPAVVG